MHRELKDLLHSAEGRSHRVLTIFLDVRGFSSFARIAESSDAAEFLRSAYIRILDDYFPNADFFKLTGDGLLILRKYDRDSLTEIRQEAVDVAVRLVNDFATICDDDDMVNFDVPPNLGIGLARGAATALISGDKVLDYSGRPLNLAARLMDIARPSGVIFDASFGYDKLSDATREEFFKDSIFIRGIAEDSPITIYGLSGRVQIPEFNRRPINGFKKFIEKEHLYTMKEFEELNLFRLPISHEPAAKDDIEVHISYPDIRKNKTKHPTFTRTKSVKADYVVIAGRRFAMVNYRPVAEELKKAGVKAPWKVSIFIEYPVVKDI